MHRRGPRSSTVTRAGSGSSALLRRPSATALSVWLPRGVEVLPEVALPVQQRDADDRHAQVGGRAQRVAGEDAEAAAVGRDRLLEAISIEK